MSLGLIQFATQRTAFFVRFTLLIEFPASDDEIRASVVGCRNILSRGRINKRLVKEIGSAER
jgi:hypothetical protein